MKKSLWNLPALLLVGLLSLTASSAFAQKDDKAQSTATKPVPRDANWVKRHEGFNAEAKKGGFDLIFIGDSITDGWRGAGKEVWSKYYSPRHALNLGIGGDRTEHVLWRLENGNVDGLKPKLAVLMIGTNNSGSNKSEEIAAGNEAIVKKLREKLPETKILVLAIFPRGKDSNDRLRQVNEKANAIIAKLADDKQVFFMDIGPKFLGADGTLSPDVMKDFLHPGASGYQTWAEAIEPKVKELMGEK